MGPTATNGPSLVATNPFAELRLAKDPGGRPRDMQDFLMGFRKARVFKAVAHKKSS